MVKAVPPNSVIYFIVLVHSLVSGCHGWSHAYAAVPTSVVQNIFIVSVIFVSPVLAALLLVRRKIYAGVALFTLSMSGAFLFGLVFHFMLDTPDLCSNVRGIGSQLFFASAVLLASVEFVGLVWGGYCWRRLILLARGR
jgi:hypothetical protein